jgi:hypothetical protein
MYRIKNIKTEEFYTVTKDGWDTIVAKGMASKYEIVEELRTSANRASKIPEAIAAAAIQEANREVTNEQPTKATKAAK